jgi:hypothetical protein
MKMDRWHKCLENKNYFDISTIVNIYSRIEEATVCVYGLFMRIFERIHTPSGVSWVCGGRKIVP